MFDAHVAPRLKLNTGIMDLQIIKTESETWKDPFQAKLMNKTDSLEHPNENKIKPFVNINSKNEKQKCAEGPVNETDLEVKKTDCKISVQDENALEPVSDTTVSEPYKNVEYYVDSDVSDETYDGDDDNIEDDPSELENPTEVEEVKVETREEFQEEEGSDESCDDDDDDYKTEDDPMGLEDTIEVEEVKVETRDNEEASGDLGKNQCNVCLKVYKTSKSLHRHKKFVHGPRNHKCFVCKLSFTLRNSLKQHEYAYQHINKLKEALKQQPNITPTTNQIPKGKKAKLEAKKREKAIVAASNGKYPCTKCSSTFNRQCQLDNHMSNHEEIERSTGIDDAEFYVNGTKVIPPDVGLKLPCDICHKIFSDKYKLQGHKRIHGKKRFICPICERPFINGFLMNKHVETHKPLAERQKAMPPVKEENKVLETFSCDLCPKTYHRQRALANHKISQHKPKAHECEICGYKFAFRDALTRHILVHNYRRHTKEDFEALKMVRQKSSEENKQVEKANSKPDNDSDSTVSQPSAKRQKTGLISELLSKKSDPQSFECDVCQKSFADYSRLRSHKRIVHKARKHKCPVKGCERTYPYKKPLLKHLESHNSESGPAEEFECAECHRIYPSYKSLLYHVTNGHVRRKANINSDKSFDCTKCDKSFPTMSQTKLHMRTIHSSKENRCHICNETFTIYVQLWQHIKIYHGKEGSNEKTSAVGKDNSEDSSKKSHGSKDKQGQTPVRSERKKTPSRTQPCRNAKPSAGDSFVDYFNSSDSPDSAEEEDEK